MNLTRKILLPLIASIIVATGLLVWQNINSQSNMLNERDAEVLEDHQELLNVLLGEHEERMLSLAKSMAGISQVQQALAGQDREELTRLVMPIFQELQDEATNFHFHVPPATSFLRVHSPESYGDDLSSRPMIVAANATQEPLTGVEPGKHGLAIRGIVSIYYQGEHVGSVEFGQFVRQEFLEHAKERTGGDLSVYVTQEMATETMTGLTEELGTDAPVGFLAYAATSEERLPIAASHYQEVMSTGEKVITRVSSQGHDYSVMLVPLQDFEGDIVAVVEFTLSRDALLAEITRNRNTNMLIGGVFVIGLSLGLGFFLSRSVLSPIGRLQQGVQRIGSGDLTHRLDIKSRDEIGTLAITFNTMADQVSDLLTGLGERGKELQERSRELEASQSVTFAASERTSPDELLGLVVDLVRDQFDLYHVQMYIVDPQRGEHGAAVLRQSTGYAGSQLLQAGHHIPLERTALVTRAIHENQAVLVADTSADPNFLPNPLLPETRSELVVPLRIGDRVLGVLDIQDRVPGRFSESTVGLFQAMSDQVAFFFENNELLERVTEQTKSLTVFTTQLRAAADVAERLSTILDPEQLLHETAELMQSRFGFYHAHIYVLEEVEVEVEGKVGVEGKLVVRAGSGEVGRVLRERGHSIPLDREKSLVARAARGRQAMMVTDTALDSDFMPNPLLPQTRSELAVPLVVGERVLGVLDMQDDQIGRFSETDVDTFSTLAGQIAASLQNASLFEQVEANAQRTQVRLDISQTLAAARTEDEVLDAMIQVAGFYPQARVTIMTIDQDADELAATLCRAEAFDSGMTGQIPLGTRFTASLMPLFQHISPHTAFISPNISLDERADPQTRQLVSQQGTASFAMLPITAGEEWLGVFTASTREENFFDERKLHLYQTLAEQGAPALQAARLRAQVQEREARFRGFAESSDYGFGMGELTGRLTYANPALLRILDEEPEDATKKTFFNYYTEEGVKEMESKILPTVMEKGQWVGEIPLVSSKGKLTPTEQNIFLIYDAQGAPAYVANIITDITERKQAEEELQKLATVVRHSAELINLATLEGQMIFLNEAGGKMLGIDPEQVEQHVITEVISEDYMDMVQSELLPTLMKEGAWEGELQYRNIETGELTDTYASAFIVTDPDTGAPLYLANVSRNITKRKRAEEDRERFTTQLRTAADLAGRINAILDPDRLLQEVVDQLHDRFDLYHVHVYLLEEVEVEGKVERELALRAGYGEPGRVMLERGHSIPLEREKSLVARAARGREIVLENDTQAAPDFMSNPLLPDTRSEAAVPLIAGGKVLGVFDVQDDEPGRFTPSEVDVFSTLAGQIATALQNAALFEEIQHTAEQLRQVDRLKGEFMSSMSHELRTPLNSIIGFAEVLLMGIGGDLSPDAHEDVQSIYDNGQHLLNIINDILDLAKIEAGTMMLNPESIEVAELLQEVNAHNAGLLVHKPLEILIQVEDGLPPLQADPIRINQILNNLISNAVKFTEKGSITLRAFREDDSHRDTGTVWLCLQVQDTGIGVSEQDMDKVFDRFQQVDGSHARRAEGTGLGLFITRQLVELHGGTLGARSQLGEGSTFTVRLPISSR